MRAKKTWREFQNEYKAQRARLHRENPHCHWCGKLTYLPGTDPGGGDSARMATIDHLKPKGDPQRHDGNPNYERRRVLACKRCNTSRKNQFAKPSRHRSLEEAWKGAGHWPRAAYISGALPGEV